MTVQERIVDAVARGWEEVTHCGNHALAKGNYTVYQWKRFSFSKPVWVRVLMSRTSKIPVASETFVTLGSAIRGI